MSDRARRAVLEVIRGRVSAERFDSRRSLSEDQVRELVRDAVQAPSSFNIQHWRFVTVRKPEDKKRLMELAYGQTVVRDAAATLVVLGDLRAHESLSETLASSVEAGVLAQRTADRWVELARAIYANGTMARDEAIRSASLAAMMLMIAAAARRLASAPLIGFDAKAVKRAFGIRDHHLPVMLLCVGYPAPPRQPRKVRLDADRVLAFDEGGQL